MSVFNFRDFTVTDAAGRSVGQPATTGEQLRRSIIRILDANLLCSIATVTPEGAPHINAAFFAYSDELDLFFLSHPESRHCRNLVTNPSVAVMVLSSSQAWAKPGRGIQLFGTAQEATGPGAADAERWYAQRFADYRTWKESLADGDPAHQYRFFRVVVERVKVLDEVALGDATFVQASTGRAAGA